MSKPRLLFISPRFLFPIDSGGKIRTTGILREMKGGAFDITLASPSPPASNFGEDMASIADRWFYWSTTDGWLRKLQRFTHLFSSFPFPVAGDASKGGSELIANLLTDEIDVCVFDFVHAAVLAPGKSSVPSVIFTHNVEAEIFARHAKVATNPLLKHLWQRQWQKMLSFESRNLQRFDRVVAVSERDKAYFETDYGLTNVHTIPTGVDLNFFPYNYQPQAGKVVFTGSMDWLANQDGIGFFLNDVWPRITAKHSGASMCVVGRNPPEQLKQRSAIHRESWHFTGFVDDVRPYIHQASAYVIPLRVGGGTRLKVFEAMASGCPVVSTSIGVEGLDLTEGIHYINAETPDEFAAATLRLLNDPSLGQKLSRAARDFVEKYASNSFVARQFEDICTAALASE